jgi:hypothetical protein
MNDENENDKYLDPNLNPLLPCNDPDRLKPDPGEWRRDDGRVPVPTVPEILKALIEGAFPEVNDFEIGGHKIVKMADGSFTLDDSPLKEVSPEVRLEIWDCKRFELGTKPGWACSRFWRGIPADIRSGRPCAFFVSRRAGL